MHIEAVLQNWCLVWQGRILSCHVSLGEPPVGIRCCRQVDVFQCFLGSTKIMNHEFSKITLPPRPPIKETRPTRGDLLNDCSQEPLQVHFPRILRRGKSLRRC